MKTGIVMELSEGFATIMQTGGKFTRVRAETTWQKGDVVAWDRTRLNIKAISAVAACFILFLFGSWGGYQFYYTEVSIISLDVNPSLEMGLNRFDRVISATAYNDSGYAILNDVPFQGMSYEDALEALGSSSVFQTYLERNEMVEIAVCSPGKESVILEKLETKLQEILSDRPYVQTLCRGVSREIAQEAHEHDMTPGKYLAFLELRELAPEIVTEDYMECGIGEIRRQIRNQHRQGGGGANSYNSESETDAAGASPGYHYGGEQEPGHHGYRHQGKQD